MNCPLYKTEFNVDIKKKKCSTANLSSFPLRSTNRLKNESLTFVRQYGGQDVLDPRPVIAGRNCFLFVRTSLLPVLKSRFPPYTREALKLSSLVRII